MSYGREKAIRMGDDSSLVGIVTGPAPGTDDQGKPAFVMLNSGILHRVGSCRLNVRMARALSAHGFTSLRFDFSGVGDRDHRRHLHRLRGRRRFRARGPLGRLLRL